MSSIVYACGAALIPKQSAGRWPNFRKHLACWMAVQRRRTSIEDIVGRDEFSARADNCLIQTC